jgi:hypothetical protein
MKVIDVSEFPKYDEFLRYKNVTCGISIETSEWKIVRVVEETNDYTSIQLEYKGGSKTYSTFTREFKSYFRDKKLEEIL